MSRPLTPRGGSPDSGLTPPNNPFASNPFDTDNDSSAVASLASDSTFTVEPSPLAREVYNEKGHQHSSSDTDIEANHVPPVVSDPEKANEKHTTALPPSTGESFPKRLYNRFRATYCPKEEPPLVLPVCPNDTEKLTYVHTNRILLYVFGVFSFLSLGAGAMCIYLLISYAVGIIGKDWDYKGHLELVERFPITEENAPTVDIFLPCCSEPLEILENTYKHIVNIDWPASKLQVHVMDDSASLTVRALAEQYGFNYSVRDDRPRLRKAGNLRWTFARTNGDFFAIFDADFCPRPDFVKELIVEHLGDDKTALVQSPQYFRVTDDQTWVEQGAGATQELFYRVVQVNRNKWGASICVGSNALYRREALVEVGGTAEIGFSEDVHTGFGAVDRGWKVKYIPLCLATGVCPNSPRAFFSQQMRWARGSTTLLTNGHFWVSNLTLMQKICYLSGFLYYSAVSLNIFLAPIAGTLLLAIRPEWFKFWNLAFAIPSILYGVILMRVWAKAKYGFNVQHVVTIQSYAYLTAIKDRLFNIELLWAASGDAKAHKSNKYRNMRILCILWTLVVTGAMVGVVTWRLLNGFTWYHPLPLIIINVYNFFINHYFMFCNW
ncbi:hypothetical protein K4K57_002567 [Colletotrichum sp. SAR 10_99]|nr:hypothetical protein K4K56_009895 [Colletotrichum sp. SAR 10_98]KAJ5013556.1 hypothetical protein K4K57_002567 [Colletotrichum sp. SAR 10_99]